MRAAMNIGRAPLLVPAMVLDFANGAYQKDGIDYASFTAMGGTINGSPTINAAGLTCSASADRASIPYGFSGDFCIVMDYDLPTDGAFRYCYDYTAAGTSSAGALVARNGFSGHFVRLDTTTSSSGLITRTNSGGPFKIASAAVAGVHRASTNGGAVATATPSGGVFDMTGAVLSLGNFRSDGSQWGVPIRSWSLYVATVSDAELQTLTS